MKESWVIRQKKIELANEKHKTKSKHVFNGERGIVYQRKQMFVCDKMDEPKTNSEASPKCTKKQLSCFGKMDKSLHLLKSEMVELAYLNVQLMEKMIEMQSQIETIKQERMDFMLEMYKCEQFEKKVERLSARSSSFEQPLRSDSITEEMDNGSYNNEGVFIAGKTTSKYERNLVRPGRKSTIDSLSSLPSVSSMQSEGSYSAFETENEEDFFVNENETASSDSGIDIRYEAVDFDFFHSATTSNV